MKKKYITALLSITLFTLFSCTSSRESGYKADYPLKTEYGNSISTDLRVRIPAGWFYAEDNKNHSVDLWLLRDDLGAAIAFTPMHIDDATINEIRNKKNNDLGEALSYSKTLRKAMLGNSYKEVRDAEYFEIKGIPFAAYQYIDGSGKPSRVVIFRYTNYFFEACASANNADDADLLFQVQNSVVSSLE